MQTVTMLYVQDVVGTSQWYQDFLGLRSGHGGPEFEMLLDGDNLLLQLHELKADHDHGATTTQPLGHGVLVFVYVDDADAAYARAKELDIEIVSDMQYNPMARMKEFTVKDPNGYAIGVCESDSA